MILQVYEMFKSIDGEVNGFTQGRTSIFLRLAGCDLQCDFCDAPKAQRLSAGKKMTIEGVADKIHKMEGKNLTITGGEPLLQKVGLKKLLYSPGNLALTHKVTIETNGAHNIWPSDDISWVVDYKLARLERMMMRVSNWEKMNFNDWVKIVVDQDTIIDAINIYKDIRNINQHVNIAFSPVINDIKDRKEVNRVSGLCQNILLRLHLDGINDVVLNVQIHKLLSLR
jgi:7-carboxy-7-deazaguanine synthase